MFDYMQYMPRAHCMLNDEVLVLFYMLGNIMTFLAYAVISVVFMRTLAYVKLDVLTRTAVILTASLFAVCGLGHLLDAVMLWFPVYNLQVGYEVLTGIISVTTAVYIVILSDQIRKVTKKNAG